MDLFPPAAPSYSSVPYGPGFNGGLPFGSNVSIDEYTRLISGIAPDTGIYVITACVEEWRDGKFIATQRKDLQINVASCSFISAVLPESYLLCDDSKTVNLENLVMSPLIETYTWRITNKTGSTIYTATTPVVNYTFTDTGSFHVRLDINKSEHCADSATREIRVYPGFKADFNYSGACINKTTQFTDASTSVYGAVNSWQWNFTGEPSSISSLQNPSHTFPVTCIKNVSLRVIDSKGCIDTVHKTIEIFDKPPLQLAFTDTLICKPDTLQLIGLSEGIYKWTPLVDIVNPDSSQPTVIPKVTTTYYADLTLDGCTNRDSVTVNVVDHVMLQAMNDTTICSGDSVVSDGLSYNWQPASQLSNPASQQPKAYTSANTSYTVMCMHWYRGY